MSTSYYGTNNVCLLAGSFKFCCRLVLSSGVRVVYRVEEYYILHACVWRAAYPSGVVLCNDDDDGGGGGTCRHICSYCQFFPARLLYYWIGIAAAIRPSQKDKRASVPSKSSDV